MENTHLPDRHYEQADQALGFSITKLCFEGRRVLRQTVALSLPWSPWLGLLSGGTVGSE
jgi:hypothetical protein